MVHVLHQRRQLAALLLVLLMAAPAMADTTHFGYNPAGAPSAYVNAGALSYVVGGKFNTAGYYYAQSGDTITEINVQGRRARVAGNDSVRVFLSKVDSWAPDLNYEFLPTDTVSSTYHTFTLLATADTAVKTVSIPLSPGQWYGFVWYPSSIDSVEVGRTATLSPAAGLASGSGTVASTFPYTTLVSTDWAVWAVVTHATTVGARGKVTFVGERDTLFTSTASNIVLSTPGSIANGDFALAWFAKGDDPFSGGFNPPSSQGWNKLYEAYNVTTGDDITAGLFWKIIKDAASEPSTHTFTWTTDNEERSGGIAVFRGVDPTSPFDCRPAIRVRAAVSGCDPITPSITTRTDSCMIVSLVACSDSMGTVTEPSGMTSVWKRFSTTAAHNDGTGMAYVALNSKGSTGTKTWTSGSSKTPECFEVTLALRPRIKNVGQVH